MCPQNCFSGLSCKHSFRSAALLNLVGLWLRGKLLNVRDASAAQIAANAEIQAIKQIMGLQHGKVSASSSYKQDAMHNTA